MKTNRRFSIVPIAFLILFAFALIVQATTITITSPVGPYPSSVSANELRITWTAPVNISSSTTAYDEFTCTGRDLLIFRNTAGTVQYVTIDSVADNLNRENDIRNYQIGAANGAYDTACFWIGNIVGWKNSTGKVQIQCSTTAVAVAVVRIPN